MRAYTDNVCFGYYECRCPRGAYVFSPACLHIPHYYHTERVYTHKKKIKPSRVHAFAAQTSKIRITTTTIANITGRTDLITEGRETAARTETTPAAVANE